jgi:UDP-GlcNAc:undecaprenyl-phosphate GlcNAc-1-phosphate transferase
MTRVLAAALTTLALGLVFVPLVRALARRVGMVAAPRKDRWHSQPTALLGGVGIFAAFAIGVAVFHDDLGEALPILAASAFLFVVGLVDDVVQIRPLTKLAAQVVAAAGIVASGLVLPWTHEPIVDAALAMLWIVGITNAVNLLDNMDGLAAGIAAIACVFLGITFATNGQWDMAVLPALLAGAAAGFLVYNFKPASIFMGDCGSMFLGCLLGGLALLSSYGRSRSVASVLLTPVLIMMIPILDTTLVAITRRLRGQPVSVGGRDHTSHRLVALGASERRAVLILYVVAAASGAVAVVVRELGVDALLAVIPGFALAVAFFGLYLGMVPVRDRAAVGGLYLPAPRRLFPVVFLDAGLCALAYVTAFALRWDFDLPEDQSAVLFWTAAPVACLQMAVFWLGGMYRVRWNEPSIDSLVVIGRAVIGAAAISAAAVLVSYGFSGPSRGALVLDGVLLLVLVTGSRLAALVLHRLIVGYPSRNRESQAVLIYGEGERGAFVLGEILADPERKRVPVGFVDDIDPGGRKRVLGLPIFSRDELRSVVASHRVAEVLVSKKCPDDETLGSIRGLGLAIRVMRVHFD